MSSACRKTVKLVVTVEVIPVHPAVSTNYTADLHITKFTINQQVAVGTGDTASPCIAACGVT